MANASIAPAFALNATIVAQHKYNIHLGSGYVSSIVKTDLFGLTTCNSFNFLIVISTQCLGFGLAGMCRRFLVWPASLIWPQNLVACTLLNTLHAEDDEGSRGMTRYRFFVIASLTAVVWCFFPCMHIPRAQTQVMSLTLASSIYLSSVIYILMGLLV